MKQNYEGRRVVEQLPPEAVTLNPPDIAVSLAGVSNSRAARSWYVWGYVGVACFIGSAALQADQIWFVAACIGWLIITTGLFVHQYFFKPQWRINVWRNGKWQVARREQNRYRAENIANEIRAAIRNGEAEYVLPQG